MAVSTMQAVSIIGLTKDIDNVVAVLGKSGVFHPDEVSGFYDDIKDFTHLQTKNIYAEPLNSIKAAISLTRRKFDFVDVSDFNPTYKEIELFTQKISTELEVLADDRNFIEEQLTEAKDNLIETEHFIGLGVEVEKLLNLKYISSRFGKIPKESYDKLSAYSDDPYVDFTVCSEDKTHYWGVYFAPIEKTEKIDKIFSSLYFEKCDVLGVHDTPKDHLKKLNETIPVIEERLKEAQKRVDEYVDMNIERIRKYLSKLEELNLYAKIRTKTLQYNNSFIIVGWIPEKSVSSLKHKLEDVYSVSVEFADAKKEISKSPPVKLKNRFLGEAFEFYTEMYGMPKYNEIDPSLFIAITYVIIFGIMFADLGQGICVSIVGLLMWKLKKMKIGKILIPCGISSAIFGTVFGSVFGFEHLLDPMYKALFGLEEKPFEVMGKGMTNTIIFAAIGIGILLMIVAMFLNVYTSLRQRNFGRALFSTSGLAGIVFYSSIVVGIVGEFFLGIKILSLAYVLCLIVLPFILIFFAEPLTLLVNGEKDWMPESWGGYIVENLFESIEVILSYVTNTMSFLRVGAFILVHAGMMLVVFVLANSVGGIGYWLIVILGNALVMVLEALLVAIQVLRLEYYEMFSRFYSGEGRAYEPVKLDIEK